MMNFKLGDNTLHVPIAVSYLKENLRFESRFENLRVFQIAVMKYLNKILEQKFLCYVIDFVKLKIRFV